MTDCFMVQSKKFIFVVALRTIVVICIQTMVSIIRDNYSSHIAVSKGNLWA